ncbi:MAG: signal peptidase I [Promethearchaeota archaeon]
MVNQPKFWQKLTHKQKKATIIEVAVVLGVLGLAFGGVGLMKVFLHTQYPMVVVTSGSMEPTIYRGDVLILKGKAPADIIAGDHENRTGDIILYDSNGVWPSSYPEPIVHRCVRKYLNNTDGKWYFITYGDNNHDTDPPGSPSVEIPVPEDKVLGVVVSIIPKIGQVKLFFSENDGVALVLILFLATLLVASIIQDILHPEDEKEKKKKKKSKELEKDKKNLENFELKGKEVKNLAENDIPPPSSE